MQVSKGKVVTFHYSLSNERGDLLDRTSRAEPLSYIHGAGQLLDGIEAALEGASPGDHLEVILPPQQAYGMRKKEWVRIVPRAAFADVEQIEVGMHFQTEGPEGPFLVTVTKVEEEEVTIDANHPLAGETLHFSIDLLSVREPTPEELACGHAHGPGGHTH